MARITEIGNRGKLKAEFNSVNEVFRVIDKLNWVPQNGQESNTRSNGAEGFYSFSDLADAKDVFRNHPERIRDFSINSDKLTNIESPGKEIYYDVTGDFLDIDKYLEGIPEVFGNAVMGNPKSVFCTINILGSFVHYTHKDYQVAKQKRVLRLVDWLESQGIRCQIICSEQSEVSDTQVIVKEFADPFDLNDLAVVMHPDWLRRIMFLVMEQSKTWTWGYGNSIDYDERMKRYQPQPEDGLYVYVGGYMPFGGKNHGIDELEVAFDKIESDIQQMIDEGRTFCDTPLVISGSRS